MWQSRTFTLGSILGVFCGEVWHVRRRTALLLESARYGPPGLRHGPDGRSICGGSLRRCIALSLLFLPSGIALGQREDSPSLATLLMNARQEQAHNNYSAAAQDYLKAVKLRPDNAELRADLGLMQHEAGDYAEAIKSFEQARRMKPSLYVPTLFLGIDFLRTRRAEAAVPLLIKAEEMNTRDPLPSLTLGQAYFALDEYVDAIRAYRRAIVRDPKQGSAWFGLGMAQLNEVESDARAMTRHYADSPYAKALYAEALAEQSRYNEAAALYRSILSSRERPPCMLAEAGFVNLRRGDSAQAMQDFSSEQTEHPECSLALLGEARLRMDAGENATALKLVMEVWARDPGFLRTNVPRLFAGAPSVRVQAFLSALAARHAAGTIDDVFYASITHPVLQAADDTEIHAVEHVAGGLAAARGAYLAGHDRSCAGMLEASLGTGNSVALRVLAACSFFTGEYMLTWDVGRAMASLPMTPDNRMQALYWSILANERMAFSSLERFEQLEPDSVRTHILMGDVYRQNHHYDDAQREYQRALALDPNSAAALLGLAQAYYGDAKLTATIATARRALVTSPNDPEINLLMGEALVSNHEFRRAAPFLLKALYAKPQMLPHVHALLGVVYDEEGKTREAIRELKLGASSDQDGSLHYRLARLYRKIGDKTDESAAIQRMKALELEQRKEAVVALHDPQTANLTNAP